MKNNHKFFKSVNKETIEERTTPFTLQEVFSFIDDTNISSLDAHELKSRIVNMLEGEKAKVNESKWNVIGSGKRPEIPDGENSVDVVITTEDLTGERHTEFTEFDDVDGFNTTNIIVAWMYERDFVKPYIGPVPLSKKETAIPQEDLIAFLNGNLAVYIKNEEEFKSFMNMLEENDIHIGNKAEYSMTGGFDPKYPYLFIEIVNEVYMNANSSMDNLSTYHNITKCLDYGKYIENMDKNVVPEQENLDLEYE